MMVSCLFLGCFHYRGSPFCVLGVSVSFGNFTAFELGRFSLVPHAPWFVSSGVEVSKSQDDPSMHQRVGEAEHWVLHWQGENWVTWLLYLLAHCFLSNSSFPFEEEEAVEVLWFKESGLGHSVLTANMPRCSSEGVAVLNGFRPCPTTHLPVVESSLWVSHVQRI
jgi:hypothetical protein